MRDMLKDLYASISESKNKKIQDKQAVVLKYMRFAMKLDDLDDVMKILQKKDASPDLISSAFRTARYLIDEAPPAKRKALSSKTAPVSERYAGGKRQNALQAAGPHR